MVAQRKSDGEKLNDWLARENIKLDDAKQIIKTLKRKGSRQYTTHEHTFKGRNIKLGVLGDSHFGNKWTDKSFLRDIMAFFKKEKVQEVYHTGDMTDGPWQRHQNVLEQYAHGFDAQVDDFVKDFPNIGIPIFLIDGNHDGWYRKGEGALVGKAIAERRDDITYLGNDEAIIRIGKLEMMLSHPDDGSAYAYSYKAQKMIESMMKMGEKLPDIILQGHYHKILYMAFGGVHYFCTGTTERQTPWMRGKKIASDMGAWMLELTLNQKGELEKLTPTLLPYKGETHKPAIK